MTFYSVVLFVHVTAVLGLCAALSFEVLSLFHLRRASTLTEVRRWTELVPGLFLVAAGSLLVIFFSESTWPCECQPSNWRGQELRLEPFCLSRRSVR